MLTSRASPARPRFVAPALTRVSRRASRVSRLARASASSATSGDFEKIAGDQPRGTLLMFSFGANIDPSRLRSRGVSPSASLLARAPGYRLNFIHRGGYATIDEVCDEVWDQPAADDESAPARDHPKPPVPHPPGGAWGAVHRISRSELALVRRWEVGYETREIDAMVRADPDSPEVRVRALVFVTRRSARLRRSVPPFREYAEKICAGAEVMRAPPAYRDMLAAHLARAVPYAERGGEYFDLAPWSPFPSPFGRR
jgi:hypothetical protein